jgi:DNA topoisomerase-2
MSLYTTIVGMAQDFVGSNNINLLLPNGSFGTRLMGGSDSASSRYIFTLLSPVTRQLFTATDDEILNYLNDDGKLIEPQYYIPVLPMLLVNGAKGVGTGYSTDIPQFNPRDLVQWLTTKLQGKNPTKKLTPYYRGFKGEILEDLANNRFISRGVITELKESVYRITELPIGTWTEDYYGLLDKLMDEKIIRVYHKNCSDTEIDIKIWLMPDTKTDNLYKLFALESYISMSNFHAFDEFGKLAKYSDQYHIMEEFYRLRLDWYQQRKDYLLETLEEKRNWMAQKMKFIKAILEKKLDVVNKPKQEIEQKLDELELKRQNETFDYLLDMKIYVLTAEKLVELKTQYEKIKQDLEATKNLQINEMWLADLQNLKF